MGMVVGSQRGGDRRGDRWLEVSAMGLMVGLGRMGLFAGLFAAMGLFAGFGSDLGGVWVVFGLALGGWI